MENSKDLQTLIEERVCSELKGLSNEQIYNLASFGLSVLNIAGTNGMVANLLAALETINSYEIETGTETDPCVRYELTMLTTAFNSLERDAQESGRTLVEFTGYAPPIVF